MAKVGSSNSCGSNPFSSAAISHSEAAISGEPEGKFDHRNLPSNEDPKTDDKEPEPVVIEDDDVQLLFSAPRRRKKRRLRSISSHPSSNLAVQEETKNSPVQTIMGHDEEHRNTKPGPTVLEGNMTEIFPTTNRGFSAPYDSPQYLDLCHQWSSDVNYESTAPWPYTPFPSSMPWWSGAMTRSTMPTLPWSSQNSGMDMMKKRKHEEPHARRPYHSPYRYRYSPEVSPTSIPASMAATTAMTSTRSLPFLSHASGNSNAVGMIDHSTIPATSRPNQEWNSCSSGISPYKSLNPIGSNFQPDIVPSSRVWTNSSQNVQTSIQPPASNICNHTQQTNSFPLRAASATSIVPTEPLQLQPHISKQGCEVEPSPGAPLARHLLQDTPLPQSTNMCQSPVIAAHTTLVPQYSEGIDQLQSFLPRGAPLDTGVAQPTTRLSDLRRKPSLYSIPVWETSRSTSAGLICTSQEHQDEPVVTNIPQACGMTEATEPELGPGTNISTNQQLDTTSLALRPVSATNVIATATEVLGQASPRPPPERPSNIYTLQNSSAGRKYSPNLIVDIAETCQGVFPFTTLAARHGVPVQKVLDTFSAIIQLPLLRNADDRRRHGELGKKRMREYREAKKAMERAREMERRERLSRGRG